MYVAKYQALARRLQINIVPGTIVTATPFGSGSDSAPSDRSEGSVLLNVASFIDNHGDILGSYVKANLWHPEREYLTSGPAAQRSLDPLPHHSVIQTPIGPVGLLVCYDLFFPEGFRALVRAGARIIIVPTFTKADDMSTEGRALNPSGEALFIQSALVTRAFENTCCIIFCNVGGPAGEGYVGLSQVAMPIVGKVNRSFDAAEPGLRIVHVDMGIVDVAERNYKIRRDLGAEGFHYTC